MDEAEADQGCKFRLLRLERHRAVTWPNCACSPDSVPKPTFNGVLKCAFVFILLLSVLSNFLIGRLPYLPKADLLNYSAPWNIPACLKLLLSPIVTDWKTDVLIVAFVAVIYAGAFLRRLKKSSDFASQTKEEVPTISASIQQV